MIEEGTAADQFALAGLSEIVAHPFGHIAVHVEQAPGVRPVAADRCGHAMLVIEPGVGLSRTFQDQMVHAAGELHRAESHRRRQVIVRAHHAIDAEAAIGQIGPRREVGVLIAVEETGI